MIGSTQCASQSNQ